MRHRFCIETPSLHNSINSEVAMNVKSVALTSIILMSLVALYGCSPDDDTATGSPLITGPLAELQGTWTYNCYFESGRYVDLTYKINGDSISTLKIYHSSTDSSCTTPNYKDEGMYLDLNIVDNVTASGFKEYQFTYSVQSYERTTLDNTTTTSGICSWSKNNTTDLLENLNCGFNQHRKNISFLNVYKIIGKNLYLGNPIDTAKTDSFPSGIKDNFIYIKQ